MFKTKEMCPDSFFKKCSFLFHGNTTIQKEDYEWLGRCHVNFLQKTSVEDKKKYRDLLEQSCKNSDIEKENYGILVALKMHFDSLCLLPEQWHK